MANNVKIERLNHAFQEEISMILMTEIKDEDIKFVTITGVETTNDLSFAKVYFTVLDDDKKESTGYGHRRRRAWILCKAAGTKEGNTFSFIRCVDLRVCARRSGRA